MSSQTFKRRGLFAETRQQQSLKFRIDAADLR
jgi:hypothetical protein